LAVFYPPVVQARPVINVEEFIGKTVGRRVPPAGAGLQKTLKSCRDSSGAFVLAVFTVLKPTRMRTHGWSEPLTAKRMRLTLFSYDSSTRR